MKTEAPESAAFVLKNEELSAVAFVRDYVEFHFDGMILRALANPSLVREGQRFVFPAAGSRDALCSLISHVVASVSIDAERARFEFDNGAELSVSLDEKDRVGPEAMHFLREVGGPLEVW